MRSERQWGKNKIRPKQEAETKIFKQSCRSHGGDSFTSQRKKKSVFIPVTVSEYILAETILIDTQQGTYTV